jgi:hypothetical protein
MIVLAAVLCLGVWLGPSAVPGLGGGGDKAAKAPANKLTQAAFDKVRGGMTLAEVMDLLGPRAEINPDPAPFGYAAPEVVVLWREGKAKRVGVVFVPDKQRVLRVLDVERTGGTYKGAAGLTD